MKNRVSSRCHLIVRRRGAKLYRASAEMTKEMLAKLINDRCGARRQLFFNLVNWH